MNRVWIFSAILLSGCQLSEQTGTAPSNNEERRLALCSPHKARNGHSLSESSPLCEHQVLTEPLTTERDIQIPFRLVAQERVRYCLVDDDGEAHTAALWREGRPWVSMRHGDGCTEVTLPSGDYSLRIRHASPASPDSTPDIVHTRWKDATNGEAASLTIATNQCPGCDLGGLDFPRLGGIGGILAFGYAGNYENADFSRSRCKMSGVEGCALGYPNVISNFDGASFDDLRVTGSPYFLGTTIVQGSGRTSYRGASFRNLPKTDAPFLAGGDFTDADFTGAAFGQLQVPDATTWKNVKLAGASVGFSSEAYPFSNALLDVATYRALRNMNVVVRLSRVEVDRRANLAKLEIDGAHNHWVWPTSETGELALADTSFRETTMSNVAFSCEGGRGSLARADFTQARLSQVGFAGCDLSETKWQQGSFTDLTMAGALLNRSVFSGSTLNALDFTSASMIDVVLTTGGATPAAKGIVMNQARVKRLKSSEGLNLNDLVATNVDLSDSNFDGATFSKASLTGARFDGASFANALLVDAQLDFATGKAAIFDGANFSGGSFAGTKWTSVSLDGTKFDATRLVGARFCGGSARGTNFNTSNLNLALLPATSVSIVAPDGTVECARIEGMNPYSAVVTSASTTCPDGGAGKCDSDARWVPALPYPVCCKPFDDPGCFRKVAGATCETACDCVSLRCNASKICQ